MEPKTLIALLDRAEALKNNTRHSWTSTGRRESVAEHSWRLSLMALLVRDEFPGANMDRVLQMCVLHDLGEAFTGDIPSFQKTAADEARESRLLAADLNNIHIAVKQLTNKPVTAISRPSRYPQRAAVRRIIDEELESVWEDRKPSKLALDTAVSRSRALD